MVINCWLCDKKLDTEKDSLFSTCTNPDHRQCEDCEKKFKRKAIKVRTPELSKHNRLHIKFLDKTTFRNPYPEVKYKILLVDGSIQTNR